MKIVTILVGFTLILLALAAAEGLAQERYIPKPDEPLLGTWTNKEMIPPKVVKRADKWSDYMNITDTAPYDEGPWQIAKSWTDSEGDVFYQIYIEAGADKIQALFKISKSGTVLESVYKHVFEFDPKKFPTTVNRGEGACYRLHYRAK